MKFLLGLGGLISIFSSNSFAHPSLHNLRITAGNPSCQAQTCQVDVSFQGLENIPSEYYQNTNLPTCGRFGPSGFHDSRQNIVGKSRLKMVVTSEYGLVEKNCNGNNLPKSQGSTYTKKYIFQNGLLPKNLAFRFRDRNSGDSAHYQVEIPNAEKVNGMCKDGVFPLVPSGPALGGPYFRKVDATNGSKFSFCFDVPEKVFAIDVVSRNSCSAPGGWKKLTLRHTDIEKYPNVISEQYSGEGSVKLTQISYSCGWTAPGCPELVPAGRYELSVEGLSDECTETNLPVGLSWGP